MYFYLLKESKSNRISNKIIDKIYNSVSILCANWEIYELDEMKISNNGNYRAFEIYSYRISYKIMPETIHVLRVQHISRNPKIL
ncbi:MAG: type II toxin-antitoxin system RelE/ParE family toxin [Flavobacterium sp.]